MIHESLQSLDESLSKGGITLRGATASIGDEKAVREWLIDDLVWTAVFSGSEETKTKAREAIHAIARASGAVPASIQPLYEAIGRGALKAGFTVPAHNIRALTYDTARALFRAAMKNDVGAFIFEIARSEIGYTEQRPAEYAACVLAAAVKEGFRGAVFLQGDHFQASAKRWSTNEREKERSALESLIDEALAAEFYNIDIDTSTLVDLSFPTVDEQQRPNYEGTAHLVKYIRAHEPEGVEISIGGEIGEVGKENTTPEEFRAYIDGLNRIIGPDVKGVSKVSIQTGTSHGGVPLADGSIAKVKIDFDAIRNISKVARDEYGISGAVQHGASTLPEEVFDQFPKSDTVEIHLATGFQNMVYDNPSFPPDLKKEIAKWCDENCADERKPSETDEQFFYKARKKAIGPYKKTMWSFGAEQKQPIVDSLEQKFSFLFGKLGVNGSRAIVEKYVKVRANDPRPRLRKESEKLEMSALVVEGEGE
jgi:fructose/tagatose bisphosphate aldolase